MRCASRCEGKHEAVLEKDIAEEEILMTNLSLGGLIQQYSKKVDLAQQGHD